LTPRTARVATGPDTSNGHAGLRARTAPAAVNDRGLSSEVVHRFADRFAADSANAVMQNAITRVPVEQIALRHDVVVGATHVVSDRLDDWSATHQGKSGRCWIFAGLNLLRGSAAREMGVVNFEFSQSHIMFWDKLERANYFLEALIETAHLPVDDRTVSFLLRNLANDGGQWHMFVALVQKHGVVPRALMPETESSQDTARMNAILRTVLRKGAIRIRAQAGDPPAARRLKTEILETVYRVLALHLGSPPSRFVWQWTDDKKAFHRDPSTSPREFAQRYVRLPLSDYVCLVHDPRRARTQGESLTVRYLGNVLEAPPVLYVNATADVLRAAAMRALKTGEPVWFGCDTDKMVHDALGVWDSRLYAYDDVYRTDLTMSMEERVDYHESQMTHAMIFTGVDIADERPVRWRVENSWGAEKGQTGFYTMNDNWFGEYVFEVAVRRDILPPELQEAADAPPTVLDPWDPMGALAVTSPLE
jgi:bleomycin hydrolase